MTTDIITLIAVSLGGGLISAFVAVFAVVRRYKNKLRAPIYPLEKYAALELSHKTDRFTGRHVTRVKVVSSSNKKR